MAKLFVSLSAAPAFNTTGLVVITRAGVAVEFSYDSLLAAAQYLPSPEVALQVAEELETIVTRIREGVAAIYNKTEKDE